MEEKGSFWQRLFLYLSALDVVLGLPAKIGIALTFLGALLVAGLAFLGGHPVLLYVVSTSILTIVIGVPTIFLIRATGYPVGYDAGYIYVYREAVYKVLAHSNRRSMQFGQTIEVKALKDGLDHWTGRYLWGAFGDVRILSKTPGFKVELPRVESSDEYDFYQVRFPASLRRGQAARFSILTNLTVTSGAGETRLVTLVIVATIRSVMRVILPVDDPPQEVKIRYYVHKNDDEPTWTKDAHFDEYTGETKFELPKWPKIGERYGIFWEWPRLSTGATKNVPSASHLKRKSSRTRTTRAS